MPGYVRKAGPVPEALDRVTAAVIGMAEAEREYREALLHALDAGAGYAEMGRAAGVTRQRIRQFAKVEWPPARRSRRKARSTAKVRRAALRS